MGFPIFINRVHVGRGRGMVLISLESPAGDMKKGEVENIEATRVAMSEATFAEITALFVETFKKIQASHAAAHANGKTFPDPLSDEHGMPLDAFTISGASSHKH